jgi:hypothetical protein
MTHVVDLRHIKEPYEHDRCSSAKFSGHVSHPRFTCSAARLCLLALLTNVPGGRIRWLEQVDRGADNPTSYVPNYHETLREAKNPFRAMLCVYVCMYCAMNVVR